LALDGDAFEGIHDEVRRILRGQQLKAATTQGRGGANVQADAAELSLRIQQALAEREESFWVERQRLSATPQRRARAAGSSSGQLFLVNGTTSRCHKSSRSLSVHTAGPGQAIDPGGFQRGRFFRLSGLDQAQAQLCS